MNDIKPEVTLVELLKEINFPKLERSDFPEIDIEIRDIWLASPDNSFIR